MYFFAVSVSPFIIKNFAIAIFNISGNKKPFLVSTNNIMHGIINEKL